MAKFIYVSNKLVNVDLIDYVDFLDSGRAMIFMNGLTQEKQNISVDPNDTRKLKALMEKMVDGDSGPKETSGEPRFAMQQGRGW